MTNRLPIAQRGRYHAPRLRRGFSLIELMMAMLMLCIVLVSLTALAYTLSQNSVRNAGRAFETGLLTQEVDRAVAAPIESLAVQLGQTTLDTPVTTPWKFERLRSITGRADSVSVRVAIRPVYAVQRQDSLYQTVLRTR